MVGFIHAKDVLFFLAHKTATHKEEPAWQDVFATPVSRLSRKILMVPETKKAQVLFKDMQRLREPMAVVLDEYGGTAGLITMEDILEEVVGQIRDDFDMEEDAIRPVAGQTPGVETFLVEGKVHIEDFCEFFGIDILSLRAAGSLHIFDTIGGFILDLSGKVPHQGEVFSAGGLVFEVTDVTQSRVRRLLVRRAMR
jgi:magnesium and cobalt transporter